MPQASVDENRKLCASMLAQSLSAGVDEAEITLTQAQGFEVAVRCQQLERVEHANDRSLRLTVFKQQATATVSISDFSTSSLNAAIEKAVFMVAKTAADPHAGLPARKQLAFDYPDLDLYHPWSITIDEAVSQIKDCEKMAMALDKRLRNSEGASLSSYESQTVYANSQGFSGHYLSSHHAASCGLVAVDKHGCQRDYDYTQAVCATQLTPLPQLAKQAAERTLKRLNPRRLKTCETAVLFTPRLAAGLFKQLASAMSGYAIYRQASFLVNQLNKPVLASHLSITENPHLKKALSSAPFDSEGVKTQPMLLLEDGVLKTYLLDSYSARQLNTESNGHGGGLHHMAVTSKQATLDFAAMLKLMGTGLVVTELIGQGVDLVTGNYSRGAFGFWVENGEIQHPVHEITIAANLKTMFASMVALGSDVDSQGRVHCGSVLIERMRIAGQ